MNGMLLPPAYLAPAEYYSFLISGRCTVEQYANYNRHTYANRCDILTADGVHALTVPVEKPREKTLIRDIRISYSSKWQQTHWRTLCAAYLSSPFFEYYQDDFAPFFSRRYTFLLDLDMELQSLILSLLGFSAENIRLSDHYAPVGKINIIDMRERIVPKKNSVSLHEESVAPYYQVFSGRFGFTAGLSIVDMLFNLGNESRLYLMRMRPDALFAAASSGQGTDAESRDINIF